MASAAFPKFSFGAGMTTPTPEEGAEPGLAGAASSGLPAAGPPLSIEAVKVEAKVPDALVKALLEYLKADPDTIPEHLAFVTDQDFNKAAEEIKIGDTPLTAIQKGQLFYFVKVLRQAVARGTAPPLQAGPAMAGSASAEVEKRKFSEVLDQVDDGPYPQLSPEKVAAMRQFHREVTGGDPPDHERPTADQLSALTHRMASGKAPFADFAVFGPYGRRQTKLMRFTAQVFVHGELVTRQLRGPGTYLGWRASWNVFRAAMIMANGASPSTLDRYARGIEELVTLFPNAWGIISLADETMRSERWDILKETNGTHGTWEEVLADSAFGFDNRCSHWWFMHVLGPLTCSSRQSAAATVESVEGLVPGGNGSAKPAQLAICDAPWKAGPVKKGKARGGGDGLKGQACRDFNGAAGCHRKACSAPHRCSGCGGPFPVGKCWTCNPSLKPAKGGSSSGPSGKFGKQKKKKGGKGASGSQSTK